ncbi:MAG: TRAP transporter large permease [Alphaproteobacteria bacterium]|nr:TRAP transporter large permease [Alphaproteobacteria bacterium]
MTATAALLLFGGFFGLLALGAPLAVALGVAGAATIAQAGLGIMSIPANVYTGIAKYPLLALPMFILAGLAFERAGVAERLVRLATAIVGMRRGGLAMVAIIVCVFLGGISGSGPADAAAVAMVMIPAMARQGYPRPFSAGLIAAAGSTAIMIPPSIAFIVYSVLVPQASVPALFAAGIVPGLLAGAALAAPALWFAWKNGWGAAEGEARPPFWASLREAGWGLAAPVIILGGLRIGAFTPTEAAVVAAIYGFFVGMLVYRTIDVRAAWAVLSEAAEISAIVMLIVALSSVFAHAGSTLGVFDAFAKTLIGATTDPAAMLAIVMVILLIAGMLLDAISIFFIFLPILLPVANAFGWDLVWFGVLITMNMAIGQFTPPMAVNLMVTSRIAGISMESTVPWVLWMVLAMLGALALVAAFPELALFLPRIAGFG